MFADMRTCFGVNEPVNFQRGLVKKPVGTFVTFKCSLSTRVVCGYVMLHVRLTAERFLAMWARIPLDRRMCGRVSNLIRFAAKLSIAKFTCKWFFARMDSHVLDQFEFKWITAAADITNERIGGNVLEAFMQSPVAQQTKCFYAEVACECVHSVLFDFHLLQCFDVMPLIGVADVLIARSKLHLTIVANVNVNWIG